MTAIVAPAAGENPADKKKMPLLPKTLAERLHLDEVLEVPAALDEYFNLLTDCEYRLDYSDGNIISMGYASLTHEALVGRIIYLLTDIFGIESNWHVLGSNVATLILDFQAVYNADIVVLKGEPQHRVHQGKAKKVKILINPSLIVEVLSPATIRYDLGVKLPRYKTLESVQHILLVNQNQPGVSLYSRTDRPGQWMNTEVRDLEKGYVTINRKRLRLADIYRNGLTE